MPNTYVKVGGVWTPVAQPYVNQSGTNTPVKAIYVKDGGSWKIAWPQYSLTYLVVGGGGGGGGTVDSVGQGSAGGAGGYVAGTATLVQGQTYTAVVGAGGSGQGGYSQGSDGGNSSLTGSGLSIPTAIGGGGAGGATSGGKDGGSGGGGGGYRFGYTPGGSGTAGQGYPGGSSNASSVGIPGVAGSGGAGGPGTDASGTSSGTGGPGVYNSITGTAVYYAKGADYATNGQANTGWGGGYLNPGPGIAGASGVVILRIPTPYYTGNVTGSPTVTTDGNNTVISFTGNGTYTA